MSRRCDATAPPWILHQHQANALNDYLGVPESREEAGANDPSAREAPARYLLRKRDRSVAKTSRDKAGAGPHQVQTAFGFGPVLNVRQLARDELEPGRGLTGNVFGRGMRGLIQHVSTF